MLKKLIKNKKAQNTAEYAILISLVVAGIIAMQTYAQRALQARVRDASIYLESQSDDLGSTKQYEPYYLESDYNIERDETEVEHLTKEQIAGHSYEVNNDRTRAHNGYQVSTYNEGAETPAGI